MYLNLMQGRLFVFMLREKKREGVWALTNLKFNKTTVLKTD